LEGADTGTSGDIAAASYKIVIYITKF
jgi:hypothetical protein